jgi:hypothetical protein
MLTSAFTLNSIASRIPEGTVWFVLGLVMLVFIALTAALFYHWHAYEMYVHHKLKMQKLYLVGAAFLFLLMIACAVLANIELT